MIAMIPSATNKRGEDNEIKADNKQIINLLMCKKCIDTDITKVFLLFAKFTHDPLI